MLPIAPQRWIIVHILLLFPLHAYWFCSFSCFVYRRLWMLCAHHSSCRMLLLQGMKHQQDEKWDKEPETARESGPAVPLAFLALPAAQTSLGAPASPSKFTPLKPRTGTVGFTHTGRRRSCGLAVPPHIHVAIDLCCEFWHLFCSWSKKMFNGSMASVMWELLFLYSEERRLNLGLSHTNSNP